MKFGIVVFPGSNCDEDAFHAASGCLRPGRRVPLARGHRPEGRRRRRSCRAASRTATTCAPARWRASRPIMAAVRAFAERGGPVLGICNGFQILLEAGLLPGAMLRNKGLKYRCEHVHLRVEQTDTPFTAPRRAGQVLTDSDRPRRGQLLRAARHAAAARGQPPGDLPLHRSPPAHVDEASNPNGSVNGDRRRSATSARNVVGMMPHPERACESAARRRRRLARDLRIGIVRVAARHSRCEACTRRRRCRRAND